MTRTIALSGGIGTGKSTVARMLVDLGATLIDADAIVRELQAPGAPLLDEIVAAFGAQVVDASGVLDREALASIVFRDPGARQRLNDIVHPKVGVEMARRLEAAREAGVPLIVLDIPLLFEGRKAGAGRASKLPFDATVLVYAPREIQIERTVARDGCPREDAERRLDAQLDIEEKRAMADHVIDNTGALAETGAQVRELYAELTAGD